MDIEYIKQIGPYLTGGVAGVILNTLFSKYKNRIQKLECCYIDDDVISKLPIMYDDTQHKNLHSKKFVITNTTNQDINSIKIIFEFESTAVVTKWTSSSKAGINIPKGNIYKKNNECHFVIKHFNRKEKVEINLEIGNIIEDRFNVIEQNITGIIVEFKDKRKPKSARPIQLVEKKELKTSN